MATRKKAPSKKKRSSKKKRGRSKKNVITLNFDDVESGGGMPTPDGYYIGEITKAEQEASSQGNDMISVQWKTHIGSRVYDNFSLLPQALWVLRGAMESMGFEIQEGDWDFDPDDLIGEKCGLEILNEEYEEKERPKVEGYLTVETVEKELGGKPAAEEEEEEEEEEEKPPKTSSKKKKKKAASKKKKTELRPGARVTFEDEEGEEYEGVIEGIDDGLAVVVDDEEGEWEIPLEDLQKA